MVPRALFQTALLRLPRPARRDGVGDRGQRFMMNTAPDHEAAAALIAAVLDWAATLPRRYGLVPAN